MKVNSRIISFALLLCTYFGLHASVTIIPPLNVWEVLRSQFSITHGASRPEVQNQIRWIIAHPGYIKGLARSSKPYIYHIMKEIEKNNLPGEIALIPMIESAYNPFAYSVVGAAGLWQLMPATASELGVKQDWWFDGRRSIRTSTEAALTYLTYLHRLFNNDWLLAFAAYDCGEGTLSKSIKNYFILKSKVSFWLLDLPQETRAYVPRLLALAEIIENPKRYKIHLPPIPCKPYFEEVNIGSQIDLAHAAHLAGITYRELIKLNPGFNRWATAPYSPFKLLIPVAKVGEFYRNLAHLPLKARVRWKKHRVKEGESLDFIAKKYHTTANLIMKLNLLPSLSIQTNQLLLIPSNNPMPISVAPPRPMLAVFPEVKQYKVIHIVERGDSYAKLEKKYTVATSQIQAWNNLTPNAVLHTGQQLIIWKKKY